jgi:hypothetical protein
MVLVHSTKLAHTSPNQATVEGSSSTNTMTYTRGSRYSYWNSWGWALWHPKHVEFDVAVNKCLRTDASSWFFLLIFTHPYLPSRHRDWQLYFFCNSLYNSLYSLKREKNYFKFVIPLLYSLNFDIFFTSESSQVVLKEESVTTARILLLLSDRCYCVIGKVWQEAKWPVIKRRKNDVAFERYI